MHLTPVPQVNPPHPKGLSKKSNKLCSSLCVLCESLCDPLCFNVLKLNTKDTKVCTKAHKGLFRKPQLFLLSVFTTLLLS